MLQSWEFNRKIQTAYNFVQALPKKLQYIPLMTTIYKVDRAKEEKFQTLPSIWTIGACPTSQRHRNRFARREDATSSPLERQIRKESEVGDKRCGEGDASREDVVRNDTMIFAFITRGHRRPLLPRYSSDTHTRARYHRHAAKRINSRTCVKVIIAGGYDEAAHAR